jgi:serine/threonine protein kinase
MGTRQADAEFLNEANLISRVQHRNLVKLLGCSIEGSERLLVYEYLQNSSLDKILFGFYSILNRWMDLGFISFVYVGCS